MTEEEKMEAKVRFTYEYAIRNCPHANSTELRKLKNSIQILLESLSVAEAIYFIEGGHFPYPFFEDTITTIRVPSGKLAFVGFDYQSYAVATAKEKVLLNFAEHRDELCHLFAEKHNIAWTLSDNDGTTHLVRNMDTNVLSIVDWSTLAEDDVLESHEEVIGNLSCEGFVYLVDYDQYLATKDFNAYSGEVITLDVEAGVYEYVAMGLKDDKDFVPYHFDAPATRYDLSTLQWVAPI